MVEKSKSSAAKHNYPKQCFPSLNGFSNRMRNAKMDKLRSMAIIWDTSCRSCTLWKGSRLWEWELSADSVEQAKRTKHVA